MRDYTFLSDDGTREIPVSEMSTADIIECVTYGVVPLDGETSSAVIERLNLELFIRERNLRSE